MDSRVTIYGREMTTVANLLIDIADRKLVLPQIIRKSPFVRYNMVRVVHMLMGITQGELTLDRIVGVFATNGGKTMYIADMLRGLANRSIALSDHAYTVRVYSAEA